MEFGLHIHNKRMDRYYGEPSLRGLIRIQDFQEDLLLSLLLWQAKDYYDQWYEGLNRLIVEDTSCLITSMRDINKGGFVNMWLMYKVGGSVYFRERIFFKEISATQISRDNCYEMIPERGNDDDDEFVISEWSVELEEIKSFIDVFHDIVLNRECPECR